MKHSCLGGDNYKDREVPLNPYPGVPSDPSSSQCTLLLPLPFPPTSCSWVDSPTSAAKLAGMPGGASHIRIVLSSEHDANIRSLRGFHTTELTLPNPWPGSVSSSAPVSRCQMYTLLSAISHERCSLRAPYTGGNSPSLPLTIKFPSTPPKQLRMT